VPLARPLANDDATTHRLKLVRHGELLLRREADAAVAILGLARAPLLLLLRLALAQDLFQGGRWFAEEGGRCESLFFSLSFARGTKTQLELEHATMLTELGVRCILATSPNHGRLCQKREQRTTTAAVPRKPI